MMSPTQPRAALAANKASRAGADAARDPNTFVKAVSDRIEMVSPDQLRPFPHRSRTHSEEQIALMVGSIEAFGFTMPALIDEKNQILAGHARVEAAKRLGLSDIPTVIATHLTADEKRAYVIADNRIAEKAGWDLEVLAIEFEHLASIDLGFDLDVTGYTTGEIDIVIGGAANEKARADAADALPEPFVGPAVSRLGDLWQLGRHRLLCGSALEARCYEQLLRGEQARMVLTDPPYNVRVQGFVGGLGKVQHREFAMASGEMSEAEFTAFLTTAFGCMADALVDGGLLYAFMDWRHFMELMSAAQAVKLAQINLCVWDKMTGGMGSLYRSQHELCSVFKKGRAPHLNNVELGRHGRYRTNVWPFPGLASFGKGRDAALASHPTVKPVALLVEAIKDTTKRGDLVLDPFLGSGSTLIAAERSGRHGAGIELDPHYCDTIVRRYEALTGEPAVHAETGLSFAELATQREADAVPVSGPSGEAPVSATAKSSAGRSRGVPGKPSTLDGRAGVAVPLATSATHRVRVRTPPAAAVPTSNPRSDRPMNPGSTLPAIPRQRPRHRA